MIMSGAIHHVLVVSEGDTDNHRLVSQSDLLSFLWSHNQDLGDEILNLRVSALMDRKSRMMPVNLAHVSPVTITLTQTARLGFKKMWAHGVREVGVVSSERGALLGSLAASDIRDLTEVSKWSESEW